MTAFALPALRQISLAVLMATASPVLWAQAASPASSPAPTARAEVGKPLQLAQDLLKSGKAVEALAELRVAEQVGSLNDYERYLIARTRAVAALKANELPVAVAAFEVALASPLTPAADRPSLLDTLARAQLQLRQYAPAAATLRRYVQEGGQDAAVRALLPQALYLSGDAGAAAKELLPMVQAEEAAGRKPSETSLRLLVSAYAKAKDEPGVYAALQRQAQHYPKPEVWAQLLSRVPDQPGFSQSLTLDLLRLKQATGALRDEAEDIELAILAMEGGLFTEALLALDAGTQAGRLGTGPNAGEHQKLRDKAAKASAKEKAQLASDRAAAQAAKDGHALTLVGTAAVSAGNPADAAKALADGLARGGVKKPDEARLHLAWAWVKAGHSAEAVKVLDTIKSEDGSAELARLWKTWLRAQAQK
ncbi:tetratricopeptide repeat protein [Ideonella paludis]|uniref:Tetratricopeptide repeat protein n=1 Tax=Ideonella paludis TaxID=1233411 RepID=A0ABS5E2U9_9BURK|nr:tetratricopeptide repeat protein [Ideonella paludis]MBQ0937696.1 tetratricopeptide repeat protein [Ideonella paludis]